MRKFRTIEFTNTIEEWIQAFNNNALAASDHTWYLGEMLYNGILYTGLETIGNEKVESFTNLNISSISPRVLEFDNFYMYFRAVNKILLVDQKTFDLSEFNTGHPLFLYIDSNLGYRADQKFEEKDNEICVARFIISPEGKFTQFYICAQRFGSNVYDTADEFYLVTGCEPLPAGKNLTIKLGNGKIKRSGILFDYHQMPDVYKVQDTTIPYNLRYITADNKVDYTKEKTTQVIPNKQLNYETQALSEVPSDSFTVQRILYDIYDQCLIMQYGNQTFDSMEHALAAIDNTTYPFPYDGLVYIPLGLLFIKGNATDLSDPEQAVLVQHLNTTIVAGDSAFFAEDSYARGVIESLTDAVNDLRAKLSQVESNLNAHTSNTSNPHNVTKSQVGLGKVDNMSYTEIRNSIKSYLDSYYVLKAGDSMTGNLNINNGCGLNQSRNYVTVGGIRLYVNARPGDAPNNSYSISI